MNETPIESPVEDVVEQHTEVLPDLDEDSSTAAIPSRSVPWDVDPADAQEQDVEVPIDDDEWR